MAGTGVFWQIGRGGRRGVRELRLRVGDRDGDLVPGTRVGGLGDELEAVRDVEGPPCLVAVGTGGTGVTRPATVSTETGVEAATAFFRGERGADTPSTIDVHSVGKRGLLLVQQTRLGGLGNRLGDKRWTRGVLDLVATAGGVGSGLVELHGDGCGNTRLKGNGEGTAGGELISNNLFQLLHEFENQRCIRPARIKSIGYVLKSDSKI